ncbi:MAG: response regulator transcription factor [Candidatus Rokubacteria bacterium]|nr:response regulator transcription factor [Candidatus Rokubacteria bacterium]
MTQRVRTDDEPLRVLVADDSQDAIAQIGLWIRERWPSAELFSALTPEEAIKTAVQERIENLVLDLDFGAQKNSGVVIARRVLEARWDDKDIRTRILFRTVHAHDAGYLHQVEKLIAEERYRPAAWGLLDKGSVPKRLVQNCVEQVFIYEVSFTEIFNQQLKNSPSRELSDVEFTVLIYVCLGVTNDGIAWLLGTSRQSVERIVSGLYRKLGIPSRHEAWRGVPTLLESRTRVYWEAVTRGLVNPHLLREEEAALREVIKGRLPPSDRLYVNPEWLQAET